MTLPTFLERGLVCFFLFLPFSSLAQAIKGQILDERSSQALPGVLVNIEGTVLEETSDANGYFAISEIPPGSHIISFTKPGYYLKRLPFVLDAAGISLEKVFLKPDMLEIQQQTAILTLTDSELDEEEGGFSNVSGLLQSSRDIFLNAAAFDFSPTFFRPRGYDSELGKLLINGIEMNKFFNGRPQWSNWGGLNDVQRNQVFSMGLEASDVSFGGLAGTTNIIMRASQYPAGAKFSYAVANRAYTGRMMGSYHTGLSEAGWAFSVALAKRFAEESYVDGSIYDADSFFLAVEKKLDPSHSLNFTTFYTPNRRGKNSPNTQEVFDLKGNRYNSYWGYQEGEIRNSRMRNIKEPVFMLNHFWEFSSKVQLNTNLAYQFGKTGNSRIDYGGSRLEFGPGGEEIFIGGGSSPDPVYYQKLPSYFLRNENQQDFEGAYRAQQELLDDGQLDWDSMYFANISSTEAGGNSIYALYEDRNDDQQLWANSILRAEINKQLSVNAALRYKQLESENFARVLDLMGGNSFLDVDSFSEGENAQNDLLHPNREVQQGDIFKYHYLLKALSYEAFGQAQWFSKKFDAHISADLSQTSFQRTGLFKNGNFPENSLGEGEQAHFYNYGLKSGYTYKFSGMHILRLNAATYTKAPGLRNTFPNVRQNNELVKDLKSEKIYAADFGYSLRTSWLRGRITGFYGLFKDATEISFYYTDGLSGLEGGMTTAFVQEILSGIEKQHMGVEYGLEAQVNPSIKLKATGSIGEYIYKNDPQLYLTSDDFQEALELGKSFLQNYRLPGGPQRAAQVGLEYRDPAYWWFSATANFFSHAYLDVAPLLRTTNFLTDSDGLPIHDYDEEKLKVLLGQEKFDSYMLLNIVGGKSWKLKNKYFGIFASINNVLNTSYRIGGFEQSRNASYYLVDLDEQREKPLFSPKYWFGPGTTYYSHVYLRL